MKKLIALAALASMTVLAGCSSFGAGTLPQYQARGTQYNNPDNPAYVERTAPPGYVAEY